MKLLYVAHENQLGGASRSLIGLIDELLLTEMLSPKDISVIIKGKKNGALDLELSKRGIKVYNVNFSWSKNSSNNIVKNLIKEIYNVISAYLFSKKIKNKKVDIVHSNSSVINFGLYVSFFIKSKHISHVREFGLEDFNLKSNIPNSLNSLIINKITDKIIYISKSIEEHYSRSYDRMKSCVIYNGIKYKRTSNKKISNQGRIIISGTIIPSKGHLTAIKAMKILVCERGFKTIQLSILGKGDDKFIEELKVFIKDNELDGFILFKGYINDMDSYRENVDIELICSKAEAFGRVTVEAMMSGVLAIASDTGANPELVQHEENGLLYSYNDSSDLANKIESILKNDSIFKKLVEQGKESANKFIIEKTAKDIWEVYKEINNG